jgi:hypothetical protein
MRSITIKRQSFLQLTPGAELFIDIRLYDGYNYTYDVDDPLNSNSLVSFQTTYKFEAKYEGCAADGAYISAELKGRCQHPIVEGSGTGVFEGVTGRLDMKDDIEAGNYP